MKKIHPNKVVNNFILFTGIICFIFLFSSCSKKMTFAKSSVVPAAEGYVKVKSDKNNNYTIDLKVKRLANPSDLTPSRKTYVVWMETKENGTKNIGNIRTSSGFLSSKLKSSLKTVTPFKPTAFYITAEDDESTTFPNGEVVLRTR